MKSARTEQRRRGELIIYSISIGTLVKAQYHGSAIWLGFPSGHAVRHFGDMSIG